MNTLVPIPTDKPPAPKRLLNSINCKCKTGCVWGCGCRRAGAFCSPMCANIGIVCTIAGKESEDYSDDEN